MVYFKVKKQKLNDVWHSITFAALKRTFFNPKRKNQTLQFLTKTWLNFQNRNFGSISWNVHGPKSRPFLKSTQVSGHPAVSLCQEAFGSVITVCWSDLDRLCYFVFHCYQCQHWFSRRDINWYQIICFIWGWKYSFTMHPLYISVLHKIHYWKL